MDRESEFRILRIIDARCKQSDRCPIMRLAYIRPLDRDQTYRTCLVDFVGPIGNFGLEIRGCGLANPVDQYGKFDRPVASRIPEEELSLD
ncbi:unnamed protein product [Prunus armeniaca]